MLQASTSYFNSLNYYNALIHSNSIQQKNDWHMYLIVACQSDVQIVRINQLNNINNYLEKGRYCLPFYVRNFSNDDFSHDQFCIDIFSNHTDEMYYPKLQICFPYVPIVGEKSFDANVHSVNKKNVYSNLIKWAKVNKFQSIHVTLPSKNDYKIFNDLGFFKSQKQLCYWHNESYSSFEDFLKRLKSKYRCQIKKEREHINKTGYVSKSFTGNNIKKEHVELFYSLFEYTHFRKSWIMSKLNKQFFLEAWKMNSKAIVLNVLYKNNKPVAVSWSFIHEGMLCGRYWGSLYDNDYVHFEVMYYLLIEYAIKKSIKKIELGFASLHKVIRGFEPELNYNFHYFLKDGLNQKIIQSYKSSTQIYKTVYV